MTQRPRNTGKMFAVLAGLAAAFGAPQGQLHLPPGEGKKAVRLTRANDKAQHFRARTPKPMGKAAKLTRKLFPSALGSQAVHRLRRQGGAS